MLIRTAEPEGVWDPTLVEGKQARYQHLNDSTVATPELYKEATSRRQPPETHGSLLNGGNLRHHTFAETETMAQILCEKPMFSKARNPSNVKFSQKTGIVSRNIELNETEERAQELRTTHKMHMPPVNAIYGTTANRHPPPEKIDALHQLVSQSPRRSHAKPSQIPLPRRLTCSDLAAGSGRGGETKRPSDIELRNTPCHCH